MIALFLLLLPRALAYEDTCKPFNQIYKDGTELCEVMWSGSFKVVDDEEDAYTMWFLDNDNNPNEDATRALWGEDKEVGMCHLNYFHKDGPPSPEVGMTECHPWKKNACCNKETVVSASQMNNAYGEGYEWDRCGPMSQACERFFVMEACFYECEPAAGLYRKYNDTNKTAENYNEWQIHQMPMKKSFCNSWYDACYNDLFCGKGNYFECSAHYFKTQEVVAKRLVEKEAADEEQRENNLVIGISVAGACAAIAVFVAVFLVLKEKSGNPVFSSGKSEVI